MSTGEDIEERKAPTASHDTRYLAIEARFIRNVHRGMLSPHDVEATVGKGHGERVPADEGNTVGETSPGGDGLADGAVLLREVQHRHLAAEAMGKRAGGSAD